MEAKNIGVLVAILVVLIFAGYIIAGGITGLFITAPAEGDVSETATDIEEKLPEEGEASGEPETSSGEEMPKEPLTELKESGLCEGVVCPPTNTTCPDREVIFCQNTCDPLTGQCSTCSPDCSEHQAAGGGGGGSPPPSPSCSDTSWTEVGWSECSPEGKQTVTLQSNCGNTKTETRDCTYMPPNTTVWVNPETQKANITDNITIDVKINTTEEVYATEFKLRFNSSILELLNIMEGGFLKQGNGTTSMAMCEIGWEELCPKINNTLGEIVFPNAKIGTPEGVSGKGTLATITFNTIDTGTSILELNVTISDSNLNEIENIATTSGSIEVV